jgi:hypothetical protein
LRADAKAIKKGEKPTFGRQATLPTLFDQKSDDKLPGMPMLNRNDTMTTLPVYSSRPGTPSGQPSLPGFELDQLDQKRPFPNRSVTGSSATSFGSNAPLISNASDMAYGRSASPAPSLPPLDTNGFPSAPQRTMTADSQNSNWSRGPPGGPPRMPSAMGDRGYTASPVSYTDNRSPSAPRSQASMDNYGRPMPRAIDDLRSNTPQGPAPSMGRRTPFEQNYPGGRSSPAPASPSDYGRNSPAPPRGPTSPTGGYQAYNPSNRSASSASPANQNFPQSRAPQYRNMTDPGPRGPPEGDYFSNANAPPMPRPGTAQSGRSAGGSGSGMSIARLASPAPYNGGGTQSPGFGPGGGQYRR